MGKSPRAALFVPLAEPHDYSNIEVLICIKSSSILHNSIGDYKEPPPPERKVENEYGRRVRSAQSCQPNNIVGLLSSRRSLINKSKEEE